MKLAFRMVAILALLLWSQVAGAQPLNLLDHRGQRIVVTVPAWSAWSTTGFLTDADGNNSVPRSDAVINRYTGATTRVSSVVPLEEGGTCVPLDDRHYLMPAYITLSVNELISTVSSCTGSCVAQMNYYDRAWSASGYRGTFSLIVVRQSNTTLTFMAYDWPYGQACDAPYYALDAYLIPLARPCVNFVCSPTPDPTAREARLLWHEEYSSYTYGNAGRIIFPPNLDRYVESPIGAYLPTLTERYASTPNSCIAAPPLRTRFWNGFQLFL